MEATLSAINIFPVKSMAGIAKASARVAEQGLDGDRMMMVTDHSGRFISQREIPGLSLVKVETEGSLAVFSAPGAGELHVPLEDEFEPVNVEIWEDTCEAKYLGDAPARWLSHVLGIDCRLIRMPAAGSRRVDAKYGKTRVSFADAFPVLLTGQSSLEDLNSRLEKPIPMNRFRPNLVISGSEPFEEDRWKKIRIGECEFDVVKPCARCVVTTVDQSAGTKTGKEPLATLAEFRRAEQVMPGSFEGHGLGPNDVLFGQNAIPKFTGVELRVGDKVEVLEAD